MDSSQHSVWREEHGYTFGEGAVSQGLSWVALRAHRTQTYISVRAPRPPARPPARPRHAAQPSGTPTPAWAGAVSVRAPARSHTVPPACAPSGLLHPRGCTWKRKRAWLTRRPVGFPCLPGSRLHAAGPDQHSPGQPHCSSLTWGSQRAYGPEKRAPAHGCSLHTHRFSCYLAHAVTW